MSHASHPLEALLAQLPARLSATPGRYAGLADQFPSLDAAEQLTLNALMPPPHTPAAVLVPIVQRAEPTVLFTQRSGHLRHHPGQISFPGGRIEAADASAAAAALREAQEEIGLDPNQVQPLGFLPPRVVISGYCMHPLVGLIREDAALSPDTNEVAEIFEVPLSFLLDERHHRPHPRRMGGIEVPLFEIAYGERRIWGATAGIVISLCHLLLGTPS